MELFFFKSYEYNKNNDFPPFLEISRGWISVDFGHGIIWNLTPWWWKNQLPSIFRRVKTYFYPSILYYFVSNTWHIFVKVLIIYINLSSFEPVKKTGFHRAEKNVELRSHWYHVAGINCHCHMFLVPQWHLTEFNWLIPCELGVNLKKKHDIEIR